MDTNKRELTSYESGIVKQWRALNTLLERGRLVAQMTLPTDLAETVKRFGHCFKAEYDPATDRHTLYFTIQEFSKYTHFCCALVRLRPQVDGNLLTHDGQWVDGYES